jgi:6-phosphofructokinase 2
MPSIVTVTFSPCIDKSTSVGKLISEKKLQCAAPRLEPGGGGINVARAIRQLGGNATAIFPSGGWMGKLFNQLLDAENVPSIPINAHAETRENIIVFEESTCNQFRFGMPGTPLTEKEWNQCLQAIEAMDDIQYLVASGSLPPGVPEDIYARLSAIAHQKGSRMIVDSSGPALKHAVDAGVYLIKPNLGELSALAGKGHLHPRDVEEVSQKIIDAGKCEVVVVSMGSEGAMLVTRDLCKTFKPPPVDRISTVGAGDSMVAGMILRLSLGKSLTEAARYGVACGSAATLNPGTELCHKEDADRLFSLMPI